MDEHEAGKLDGRLKNGLKRRAAVISVFIIGIMSAVESLLC